MQTHYYTLINTSIGDDPAVVVVNSALRNFADREDFSWHLRISIDCKMLGKNGMPTDEEGAILTKLEESIENPLIAKGNAIFLARITAQGIRVLLYRVADPEAANEILQSLVEPSFQLREWDYRMEYDPDWELAQPELRLLERDNHIN